MKYGMHHKIKQRFFGPFKISNMVSFVTVGLDHPPTSRIHPEIAVSNESVITPQAILAKKRVLHDRPRSELLVQWSSVDQEDTIWERKIDLCRMWPSLRLVDKLCPKGEGIVMTNILASTLEGGMQKHRKEIEKSFDLLPEVESAPEEITMASEEIGSRNKSKLGKVDIDDEAEPKEEQMRWTNLKKSQATNWERRKTSKRIMRRDQTEEFYNW